MAAISKKAIAVILEEDAALRNAEAAFLNLTMAYC